MSALVILVLIFNLVFFVGCDHKRRPPLNNPHAAEAKDSLDTDNSPSGEVTKEIEQKVVRPEQAYEAIVKPLENRFLTTQAISNAEFRTTQKFRNDLQALNRGLLLMREANDSRLLTLIERYDNVYFSDCVKQLTNCSALSFLASSANTVDVLFAILDLKAKQMDVQIFYNYLHIAMRLMNDRPNSKLKNYYLARIDEILVYFEKPENKTSSGIKQQDHLRVFNQMVSELDVEKDELFIEKIVHKVQPLFYDRSKTSQINELRRMTFSLGLAYYAKNENARFSLRKSIQKLLSNYQKNRIYYLNSVVKGKEIAKNLGIRDEIWVGNEYSFLIVDSLFTKRWNSQEAQVFYDKFLNDPSALVDLAKNYIRAEIAYRNVRSATFMKDNFVKNWNPKEVGVFENALREAGRLAPLWNEVHDGVAVLVPFLSAVVGNLKLTESRWQEEFLFFHQIKRSIKLTSVYSHMWAVIYYLSESDYRDRITYYVWTWDINSDKVLDDFLNGEYPSWFNFTQISTNELALNRVEVLMSFYYGLMGGVFDIYGINVEKFIDNIGDRLLAQPRAVVEKMSVTLQGLYNTSGGKFEELKNYCLGVNHREILGLWNLPERTTQWFKDVSYQDTLSFYGATFSTETKESNHKFFAAPEFLERIRIDLNQKLDDFESIINFYSAHLNVNGKSYIFSQQKVERQALRTRQVRRFALGLATEVDRVLRNCDQKVFAEERRRQDQILAYERHYLRKIYDDFHKIKNGDLSIEQANRDYKFSGLPNNYTGFNHFYRDSNEQLKFDYYAMDFYIRMAYYLQNGFKLNDRLSLPEIAPEIHIDIYSDYADFSSPFTPYTERKPMMTLDLHSGKNFADFERQTLSLFGGDSQRKEVTFVKWRAELRGSITHVMREKFHFLAALSKFGLYEYYDFSKRGCHASMDFKALDSNCLQTNELKSVELSRHAFKLYKFSGFSDQEEVDTYKLRGLNQVVEKSNLIDVVFDSEKEEPIGLLNAFHAMLSQPLLGKNWTWPSLEGGGDGEVGAMGISYRSFSQLDFAEAYYRTVKINGELMFKLPQTVQDQLSSRFVMYVKNEFRPLVELERQALALREQNESADFNFFFSTQLGPYRVPYLGAVGKTVKDLIKDFNDRTGQFYKQELQSL